MRWKYCDNKLDENYWADPRNRVHRAQICSGYLDCHSCQGVLDLVPLKDTIRAEVSFNNLRVYGVRGAAERPSLALGAQDGMGLGSRD